MNQWKVAVATIVINVAGLAGASWAAPFTRIISPASGQCVTGPNVMVKFEAGGVAMGPKAHNLHFKLDDEPFHVQFDGNHAHVFKNVAPGTHTIRVYFADSLHRAIPGSQSVTTFNVAYGNDENRPTPGTPLLTYNLPQGEYLGADAADITVDFLVENATLSPGGYQVAYYVDGRRFLVHDACEQRTLKNLTPGPHRVRMELQDANGDLLPGAFNSEERVITVSPFGKAASGVDLTGDYKGQPRLASIPGANTLGGPRPAVVAPLTDAQIAQQKSLTIHTGEGTVGVDGVPIAIIEKEVGTAGHSASAYSMMKEPEAEGAFTVNQDGLSEQDVQDLDLVESAPSAPLRNPAVDAVAAQQAVEASTTSQNTDEDVVEAPTTTSSNIRRGSIAVRSSEPAAEVKDPDDDELSIEQKTEASEKDSAKKEDSATTPTSRIRADGSRSAIHPTTGTLKLDRQATATVATEKTTVTLTLGDSPTTTTSDNAHTSGSRERRGGNRGERGDRPQRGDRAPRADRSATTATEAAPESN